MILGDNLGGLRRTRWLCYFLFLRACSPRLSNVWIVISRLQAKEWLLAMTLFCSGLGFWICCFFILNICSSTLKNSQLPFFVGCFVFLSLFRKAVHQASEVVILLFRLSSRTKFDAGKSLLILRLALTMFTKDELRSALPRVRIHIPTQQVYAAPCSSRGFDLCKPCRPAFSHGSQLL